MDIKDVESLAALTRIRLSEDEKREILSDMKGILEYVKQIEELDVKNTEKEFKTYNIWREDLPRATDGQSFSREIIIEQFPNAQDGFLKVKKIL